MSGPKVVRIVTRDEIVAICLCRLARVDAALEHWIKVGRRYECLEDTEITAAQNRRNELAALIASERFMDLQKRAPQEEAFLRSDLELRLAKVAAEAAAARSRERRAAQAVASLVSALKRSGKPIGAELELALKRAAAGLGDENAVAAGFALLAAPDPAQSEAVRAHAIRLKEGDEHRSFTQWLAAQPTLPGEATLERLETRIASIAQLGDDARIADWKARLQTAAAESEPARRGLLIDSLDVELSRALTALRALAKGRQEALLLLAELKSTGISDAVLTANAITEASDLPTVEVLIAKGRKLLEVERASAAAAARRLAVLKGLAALGYEVTEGMSTAWVEEGRVVLRKAAQPGYGVELGSAETDRLQMRAVALTQAGVGPDPRGDIGVETTWCGDVTSLSVSLSETGGELLIERALAVGVTPLKRVEVADSASSLIAREGPVRLVRSRS
jgi:hypothetical protein